MPSTLTIRLSDEDRATLTPVAEAAGKGISTLVRELAEREARNIRHRQLAKQVQDFMEDPGADAAIEAVTLSSVEDWPAWDGPLPEAWR